MISLTGSDDLAVQVQQARDLLPAGAAHSALGADAPGAAADRAGRLRGVDEPHLFTGGAWGLIGWVIRHEREVDLGVRVRRQPGQRREVALLTLVLRHGEGGEA